MRHSVALGLIAALLEVTGLSATLHTHAYSHHEHPEHRHGIAAHTHHEQPAEGSAHERHGGLTWGPCDPGVHTTSIRFISTASLSVHLAFGSTEQPFTFLVVQRREPLLPRVEVRVHGPPVLAHLPPRAPPVIALPSIT